MKYEKALGAKMKRKGIRKPDYMPVFYMLIKDATIENKQDLNKQDSALLKVI